MAKKIVSKRLKFPKGRQASFIRKAQRNLKLGLKQIADLLKINIRTLTDWKREKFLIPFRSAKILSKRSGVKISKNVKIKDAYWYVNKGAKKGGLNCFRKYGRVGGDPEKRQKKWIEWWEKEGKFKKHPLINKTLYVNKPKKSLILAEFTGIILGDGGLTKNQLRITLNYKDDSKYIKFVVKMIKKLFKVNPSLYLNIKDSVYNIAVSRKELIMFCQKIGLKVGNKVRQQVDIPEWIKTNKKFSVACLKGLVDTDGSIFTHNYKVNKKWYSYKKLDFSSKSKPLRMSVYKIMRKIGLNPRLSQDKSVRLDSIKDMKKYFFVVGTHNPKHLKRYLH